MNTDRSQVEMIADEMIMNRIYILRGRKVMIDEDLALLYNSGAKRLRNLIRRNASCFPEDFMFKLNQVDFNALKSQDRSVFRDNRELEFPLALTEQGLAMLFGLVKGAGPIEINIRIIRIFTLINNAVRLP